MLVLQVGVGVLILWDGKVLLGCCKGSYGVGCWLVFGGYFEFGEVVEDCVLCEVLEEIGLVLSELCYGLFSNDVFEGCYYFIVFILVGCVEDVEVCFMELDKCDGWVWFDWVDLLELLFVFLVSLCWWGYLFFDLKC